MAGDEDDDDDKDNAAGGASDRVFTIDHELLLFTVTHPFHVQLDSHFLRAHQPGSAPDRAI